jgi:hypothetical protein
VLDFESFERCHNKILEVGITKVSYSLKSDSQINLDEANIFNVFDRKEPVTNHYIFQDNIHVSKILFDSLRELN